MAEGHFSPTTADGTSPSFHAHLDPLSFTAFRLEHATEPHLHYTTRRVFIGPTPINWLKSHRSTWSKSRIRSASTGRGITFTPDTNVIDRRKLTQLDVGTTNGGSGVKKRGRGDFQGRRRKPTTPTRSSSLAGISSRDQANRTETDSVAIESSSQEDGDTNTDIIDVAQPLDDEETRNGTGKKKETAETNPDFVTARTQQRDFSPVTLKSRRADTFQTARETLSDSEDSEEDDGSPGPSTLPPPPPTISLRPPTAPERPSVLNRHALAELPSIAASDLNEEGPSSSTTSGAAGRSLLTNSAASLLDSHNHDNTTRSTTRPKLDLGIRSPLLSPPIKSALRRHTRGQSGTANGMVRFNTQGDDNTLPVQREPQPLKKRRSLRKASKGSQGEILKISKMLICVEVTQADLSDEFDENEAAKIATRVLDKWKEYVVVCRDAGNEHEDVEFKLQLYSNRKIPAKDVKGSWMMLGGGPAKEILLNRKNTRINMYSSLDKTLVIYHPHKLGNVFYVLRPDTMAKSVEWYTFLQDRLGITRAESLDVTVPDLNIVLRLDQPFAELKREVAAVDDGEDGETVTIRVLDHAARSLIMRSLKLLQGGKEWSDILEHWETNERIGLAWRRYDRIEWIFGENETKMYGTLAMQKTHELELRPKVHYPTEVILENKEVLREPPPVEGFLIRLSTATGKSTRFGRIFFRRHYFYSQNHLLFFCKPSAAVPPPPPHLVAANEIPTAEEIADKTPLIYAVTPYSLTDEGSISWLHSTSRKTVQDSDSAAYSEGHRNVVNTIASDGFVDLRKIKTVKLVIKATLGDTREAVTEEGGWSGTDSQPPSDDAIEDCLFDIEMTNGLTLRLQAYNTSTRDEWITRLRALSTYWAARTAADSRTIMTTRQSNLTLHGADAQNEFRLGQTSKKWEVHNSLASPTLHHFCGISSCRTITFAGSLYMKPRKHTTFRKLYAVLVHGKLILYESNYRHPLSGVAINSLASMKHSTLPLQHVYLLSNLLTSSSLLTPSSGPSTRTYLARVYEDGVTSSDTDDMLTFCLWMSPRRVFVGDGKGGVKRVGALGREGSVRVFKARTRVERDMWVGALGVEIERGRGDEEWDVEGEGEREGGEGEEEV